MHSGVSPTLSGWPQSAAHLHLKRTPEAELQAVPPSLPPLESLKIPRSLLKIALHAMLQLTKGGISVELIPLMIGCG